MESNQQQSIDNTISDLVFKQLLSYPENKQCFDCGQQNPTWASASNGIFLCSQCAPLHRALGIYYSSVRSLTIDTWGDKALKMMTLGGNKNLYEFFKKYDLAGDSVEYRYKTKAADFYRQRLRSIVDGQVFDDEELSYNEGRELIQEKPLADQLLNQDNQDEEEGMGLSDMIPNPSELLEKAKMGTIKAVDTGLWMLNSVSSMINQKIEETGVRQQVGNFVHSAADKTMQIGSQLKDRGSERLHQAEETYPVVATVSEKSKQAMGIVSDVSTSIFRKIKTMLNENNNQNNDYFERRAAWENGDSAQNQQQDHDDWENIQRRNTNGQQPMSQMSNANHGSNGLLEEDHNNDSQRKNSKELVQNLLDPQSQITTTKEMKE
eukprot:403358776